MFLSHIIVKYAQDNVLFEKISLNHSGHCVHLVQVVLISSSYIEWLLDPKQSLSYIVLPP